MTLPVTVSVVMPCYNAEPHLAQAIGIGSVPEQTPPDALVGASGAATLVAL